MSSYFVFFYFVLAAIFIAVSLFHLWLILCW